MRSILKIVIEWLLGRVPREVNCACHNCGMDYYRHVIGAVVVCLMCRTMYRVDNAAQ